MTMETNQEILNRIRARGIHWLTHFTLMENVGSILERGVVPRASLSESNVQHACINDQQRRDGYLDGTCLSIEWPNTRLLNSWEKEKGGWWAILLIDPTIIASMPCKLFRGNAASSIHTEINKNLCPTVADFEELFSDHSYEALKNMQKALGIDQNLSGISKAERGWGSADTSDPQAEVIVFDVIPPGRIKAIVVRNQPALSHFKRMVPRSVLARWNGCIEVCDALFQEKKRERKNLRSEN